MPITGWGIHFYPNFRIWMKSYQPAVKGSRLPGFIYEWVEVAPVKNITSS